jgi:hypothetical protein
MPFNQPFPRSFTTSSIRDHAPAASGVCGISNAAEWIYIGETDNIQEALLGHLQGLSRPLLTRQGTGFVYEICGWKRRPARQDRLILEYGPACNRAGRDSND